MASPTEGSEGGITSQRSPLRRWLPLVVKVAISLLLIGWLLQAVDGAALRRSVVALSPLALCLAALLIAVQAAVLGWRWHRIVRWLGDDLPACTAIRWVYIGLFFNQALPSSVGGDAVRIWLFHRRGSLPGLPFASVAIERGTGMVMLALMVSACMPWLEPASGHEAWLMPLRTVGPVLLLLLVGLAVLDKVVGNRLPLRLADALVRLGTGLRQIARSPSALAEVASLGALASLLGLTAAWVLGRDLGMPLGLPHFVALVGGSVLLSVLPVSLGGWGLREATMVALFGLFNQPPEPVLTLSVVWGAIPLLISLPAGALWLIERGKGARP